ncbi:MAG: hypothetical protein COB51_12170 [Moraxellaceae bacterium]|nr:MAG: hypothetical protein COB51_12170 [Moraxellaceae bacterium]
MFVPTNIQAAELEKLLSKTCPNIQITVFPRVKDFMTQVAANKPVAILAMVPTIKHIATYKMILEGKRQGNSAESYLMVSVDKALDLTQLATSKIGVLDILGRKQMKVFMSSLLGSSSKLKRVIKQEDLLPLLSFNSVDAIFVSESLYSELKANSQLNLVTTPLEAKVGLASIASMEDTANSALVGCVMQWENGLKLSLGVDQWAKR